MTPLELVFLAFVCSIFGTTSESADGHNITDKLYEADIFIPRSHLYHKPRPAMRQFNIEARGKRETEDPRCEPFKFKPDKMILTHPTNDSLDRTYSADTMCMTTIKAEEGHVIVLTFIDVFEMEERPPKCANDYLEIRDGEFGYAHPVYRLCGKGFPQTIVSSGPYLWLKFKSDNSIEYAGFKINIEFRAKTITRIIPDSCVIAPVMMYGAGEIGSNLEDVKKCREQTSGPVDIQWRIETPTNTKIYLNFTEFELARPNECHNNMVQVFGPEPNFDYNLGVFCGSVATPITTKDEPTNVMYVRMFSTHKISNFTAQFTGFRILKGDDACDKNTEVDCRDGTCIDIGLKCDKKINCRLKADEDSELCQGKTESLLKDADTILIVLSLILTVMGSIFIFKCAKKLYQDQKKINEHIAKSCEDRLDKLGASQLSLGPNCLFRDMEPRASLERENQSNELCKQKRNKRKSSSIDSEFQLDLDINEDCPESQLIPTADVRVDRNRAKREVSQKEESPRSKNWSSSREEARKDSKDVAVEAPAGMEAGCQTRESLFLLDPVQRSDGTKSGTNSRKLSTFAFPEPEPNTSQITIELLQQSSLQESSKSQADSRPTSSETTRSAPDVIIIGKPTAI